MFTKRAISRRVFDLLNIVLILSLLFGSTAYPTQVTAAESNVASSVLGQASGDLQPKLQVVTFAPLADACSDSCAQTQADNITSCTNALGPDVCPECGDALAQCLADIEETYTTCTSSCALPPDGDGDGVADSIDNCPLAANADQMDLDADGLGDICDPDDDNDSVSDSVDNCPLIINANQIDQDLDGLGDVCDPFPLDSSNLDSDSDGVSDSVDNCPLVANPNQFDADTDALGDACDPFPFDPENLVDSDSDTFPDDSDNCPFAYNPDQSDADADGLGDVCDPNTNEVSDQTITVTTHAPANAINGSNFTVEATASSGFQ